MASDLSLTPVQLESYPAATEVPRPLRVWPALALVALYWAQNLGLRWLEMAMFTRFLLALAAAALLALLFLVWWLTNRRIAGRDRLACLGAAVGGGILSALLAHKVGVMAWLLLTLPWVVTSWALGLLLVRAAAPPLRRRTLETVLLLTWSAFLLFRFEGLRGDGQTVIRWRWSLSAEDLYRAERAQRTVRAVEVPTLASLRVGPGDWPGFRGPARDGVARGLTLAASWKAAPPRLLWRQRVGPGWSSMAVVGGCLFTQEQRDATEAVVCLDARTGREVWVHEDATRFSDDQAGPGPRSTPTLADGRLYTLGATGILNCLDAVTGERKWSHDLVAERGAKKPMWGFSSSPLVVQGLVVVFAEREGGETLLAFDAHSGALAWAADAGKASYSSPQRASLDGMEQILFVGERGLIGVDPNSGAILWEHDLGGGGGMPRSLQPHPLGEGRILLASERDGAILLEVKRRSGSWSVSRRWASRTLKPTFNDFVTHEGSIFGFDGGIFCCVDVATGKRRWREGRYGYGQVLLLADAALLLVVSEDGEAILLKANPKAREEIGRLPAIEGKTWNHPVIARGRLYVRNGEEMACYQLSSP